MHKIIRLGIYLIISYTVLSIFSSCASTKKVAYFNDIADSAKILSPGGMEAVIQKKDILSITVSSLSNEATVIFNTPNLPMTPSSSATANMPQTAGYLVGEDGTIKFPVLGNIPAAGLTQKQLQNNITELLINKKLLFDPIVNSRFLNFRVTVLGEVNHPGVVVVPSEQISILEAIGQAGDLTIYGVRNNVMLIRQVDQYKIIKRLNLNSSSLLKSPYFFLKSNDVIYVEASKTKVASTDFTRQLLPIIFSGISVVVIVLNSLLK